MKKVFVTYHHMAEDWAALCVSFNSPVLRDEEIGRTVKVFSFADWQSLCRMASRDIEVAKAALEAAEANELAANIAAGEAGDIETDLENRSFAGEDVADELAEASANFKSLQAARKSAWENTEAALLAHKSAINAFRNLGANLNQEWK